MEPTKYSEAGSTAIPTAAISGNFEESPVALDYHMEITDSKITGLEIILETTPRCGCTW